MWGAAKALSLALFLSLCRSLRAASGVTVGKDLEDKQHHTYTPNKTLHTCTHTKHWEGLTQYHYTHKKKLQIFPEVRPLVVAHTQTHTHTHKHAHTHTEVKPVTLGLVAEAAGTNLGFCQNAGRAHRHEHASTLALRKRGTKRSRPTASVGTLARPPSA